MVNRPGRRGHCRWQLGTTVPRVSLDRPTMTLSPVGDGSVQLVTRFSLGRGLSPLVVIPALHGRPIPVGLRPLSHCLYDVSALPVICFPKSLFALAYTYGIAQHCTPRVLPTLCFPSALQVRI
jgi:hypothetical protein